MKKVIIFFLCIIGTTAFAQQVNRRITDKNVTRVLQSLTGDDMMGRPAMIPDQIEKAAAFIEQEFKTIGLSPLKGLTGFRQEFERKYIRPQQLEVILDDHKIAEENVVLISEKQDINISRSLQVKSIHFSAEIPNTHQYFYKEATMLINDTTSSLVIVAPEFKSVFLELKGYFGERIMSGQRSTKVFVLGAETGTTYSIKATQQIKVIKMTNITGMLNGKLKADEMVVFSGHYDHLGMLEAVNNDSIANGADDDASGTTAVIELARYFKKAKANNRTLIFVAFTAEEIGGFGSQYFSKQLNPDKVVAMFNIEMIGKPSKWGESSAFITGYEKSDFGAILQKNLKGSPFQFYPDPYPEQNLFYRSDNATLAKLGVPAHTISTDQIPDDKYYHTVDDEFNTLNVKNITNTIRAIAISSTSIVAGTDTPKRIDKTTLK